MYNLEDILGKIKAGQDQHGVQQQVVAGAPATGIQGGTGMVGASDQLAAVLAQLGGCRSDFRLLLTTEPHYKFPIGLLQLSIKATNEPPSGLRAGLMRSFTVLVDNDRLDRIETNQWRTLTYALCFLHSIALERRKFGPMGFCVPYEFNDGDLNACLTFLERHLFHGALSWATLQYMVSEVQYGGKITDNFDRRLFRAKCEMWLAANVCRPGFQFRPKETLQRIRADFAYGLPAGDAYEDYVGLIKSFPDVDSPEIFGLHPNADLTYRNQQVESLLKTILETHPETSAGGGRGKARDEIISHKCMETLEVLPADFEDDDVTSLDSTSPLNIFLSQEIERLQLVINKVRSELKKMLQALRGEVIITSALLEAMDSLYDARVPHAWIFSPSGDEISWLSPSAGHWVAGLSARDSQLRSWLNNILASKVRPKSYWFPGFFNPAGFLTAVQQEITRLRAQDGRGWTLDNVKIHADVTKFDDTEQLKQSVPTEGMYIDGLFLDGATWDRTNHGGTLAEALPKKLFATMPILFITAVTTSGAPTMLPVTQGGGIGSAKQSTPTANGRPHASDLGPYGGYECPVYRYARRTDRYYIFSVTLPTLHHTPNHWILRGVALLCITSS